jgi:4-amino-4-deoxy-L-arabinose transferase-like glycosyltransferase
VTSTGTVGQPDRNPSAASPTVFGFQSAFTALLVALTAILAVRIAALALNRTDLFFDEAQYWYWSLEPAFGYYSKPPLIAWLITASTTVCGTSEFCIRLPSPILHTATALLVYVLASRLYNPTTGALAALAFALMPGVSFSAGIISTDVPLLLCWAAALIAFAALFDTKHWWPAALLGIALGAGLNAKYAMAWFALCAALYLIATPHRRLILRDSRLWTGVALGALLIVPNMLWNRANSFATFAHTADNAKWHGALLNPDKAAEFFGSQFGVFGPLYFAGLLVVVARAFKTRLPEADRLLLAFCLPLIVIITGQAFVSRAHANWAAVAYIAGVVLVVATLVRELSWGWLKASYAIHAVLFVGLIAATSTAGLWAVPGAPDPFARTLGWQAMATATRAEIAAARAAGKPYTAVISDDRSLTAELLYYMREEPTRVLAWRTSPRPNDHFELTRPFTPDEKGRVLLVTLKTTDPAAPQPPSLSAITSRFQQSELTSQRILPTGSSSSRRVTYYALSGYKG